MVVPIGLTYQIQDFIWELERLVTMVFENHFLVKKEPLLIQASDDDTKYSNNISDKLVSREIPELLNYFLHFFHQEIL